MIRIAINCLSIAVSLSLGRLSLGFATCSTTNGGKGASWIEIQGDIVWMV